MNEIYVSRDHIMMKSDYDDPTMHAHFAAHLLLGLEEPLEVVLPDRRFSCRGVRIPSMVPHTVRSFGKPLLVFLFESTGVVSNAVRTVSPLEEERVEEIAAGYRELSGEEDRISGYRIFYEKMMRHLEMLIGSRQVTDERILHILRRLRDGEVDLSVAEAARRSYLSESRFSHLFHEQVGISFAGYVIQNRIFHAYRNIHLGMNITDAAVEAGFSSASHFATVHRQRFGVTVRAIVSDYRLYDIAGIWK